MANKSRKEEILTPIDGVEIMVKEIPPFDVVDNDMGIPELSLPFVLVVKSPFRKFKKGSVISDPALVKEIIMGHEASMVIKKSI